MSSERCLVGRIALPARGIRTTLGILPRNRHAIIELPSASVIYPIVRIIGLLTASAVGPIVRSLWWTSCRSVCVARTRLLRDLRNLLIERHFSERQYHRTSYGIRCWSDRLLSSEDFLQVGLRFRARLLRDLRLFFIVQHF